MYILCQLVLKIFKIKSSMPQIYRNYLSRAVYMIDINLEMYFDVDDNDVVKDC